MVQQNSDELFMQRCLELAKLGNGKVSPNPMVGSVIVYNGKIIGEGYHQHYGGPHAEVNAIASVKNKTWLKKSTLYVSLEPCSHVGKTPPCSQLIIQHKIPHVVIGMQDPFAKVNGAGINQLKAAGCNVKVGVLEQQAKALNASFMVNQSKSRPYVVLKWAKTLDGFIDIIRSNETPQAPTWITNEVCRALVHKWRTEQETIMVGTTTAMVDNPQLNVRSWHGKMPLRIVLDNTLKLPHNLHLFDQKQPTLVVNSKKSAIDKNIEYLKLDFDHTLLNQLLTWLKAKGYARLFVEGGYELIQSFLKNNLWDEARVFTGNVKFYEGIRAPIVNAPIQSVDFINDNTLTIYRNGI